MILYHWAPRHLVDSIKRDGLTLGRTPCLEEDGSVGFLRGHNWCTTNKSYDAQNWARPLTIDYSRRAYRITINIPAHRESSVWTMDQIMAMLGDKALPGFNDFPEETKDWRCFMGAVPPQYFTNIRCMED